MLFNLRQPTRTNCVYCYVVPSLRIVQVEKHFKHSRRLAQSMKAARCSKNLPSQWYRLRLSATKSIRTFLFDHINL